MAVLEMILSGSFALGGVGLERWLTKREKVGDREDSRRQLLRQKAEQIYLEIEAAQDRSMAIVTNALRDLHGKLPPDEVVAAVTNRIDRLKALLHMYFPDASPLLAEYDQATFAPVAKHSETFKEIEAKPDLTLDQKLAKVKRSKVDCETAITSITTETLVKIRSFMNAEVKKLI